MSDQIDTTPYIYYFEPDPTSGSFSLVKAKFLHISPHSLIIEIDGVEYELLCGKNLLDMRVGNLLLVYADYPYMGMSKKQKQLFSLPPDLKYTKEKSINRIVFNTPLEKNQIVNNSVRIKNAYATINCLIGDITGEIHQLKQITLNTSDTAYKNLMDLSERLAKIQSEDLKQVILGGQKTPPTATVAVVSQNKEVNKILRKNQTQIKKLFK